MPNLDDLLFLAKTLWCNNITELLQSEIKKIPSKTMVCVLKEFEYEYFIEQYKKSLEYYFWKYEKLNNNN